jgi:hypothetical protein
MFVFVFGKFVEKCIIKLQRKCWHSYKYQKIRKYNIYAGPQLRVCAHAYCHAHAHAPLPTPTHMRPLSRPCRRPRQSAPLWPTDWTYWTDTFGNVGGCNFHVRWCVTCAALFLWTWNTLLALLIVFGLDVLIQSPAANLHGCVRQLLARFRQCWTALTQAQAKRVGACWKKGSDHHCRPGLNHVVTQCRCIVTCLECCNSLQVGGVMRGHSLAATAATDSLMTNL